MEDILEKCVENIKERLRLAGRYTSALDTNITVAAGTLYRYTRALDEVKGLKSLTVTTPNGALQQHPALKCMEGAEKSILNQLKELGLTAEGTRNTVEGDPLSELVQKVRAELNFNKDIADG